MDSNIMNKEFEYTKEEISEMKRRILICEKPYSEQDVKNIAYDGDFDIDRMNAYMAVKTLTRLGIPLPQK